MRSVRRGIRSDADFDDFVRRNQAQLQRAAWMLTGDWAGAEDLTQEVLLRTWRRWNHLRGMTTKEAYVRKMLLSTFLTRQRRRWRLERPAAVLDDVSTGGEADRIDDAVDLTRLVSSLPPRQRAVIALRYVFDYTESDVAELMGTSVGTVKSQHAKALRALRADAHLTAKG